MDVKKMTEQELREYVAGVYDVCVELIRRTGYYPKWEAIGWDYQCPESAVKIASAICGGHEEYIEQCFVDLWDEAVMNTAGIDEDEYYEEPEIPMWKRDDWRWNEETEVWEEINNEEHVTDEELKDYIDSIQKDYKDELKKRYPDPNK